MTTSPQALLTKYHALPDLDKTIVQLFSLYLEPLRQEQLLTCLEYLKKQKLGDWPPIDRLSLSQILRKLEAVELLRKIKSSGSLITSFQPLIRSHVLLDVLDHGHFNKIQDCLRVLRHGSSRHTYSPYFFSLEQGLWTLQDQLFTESTTDQLEETIVRLKQRWGAIVGANPILYMLVPSLLVPLLRHCTHGALISLHLVDSVLEKTEQAPELVDFLIDEYQNKKIAHFPLAALLYLLLSGRMDKALHLVDTSCSDDNLLDRTGGRALILCVQGKYDEANLLFADLLNQIKKMTGKRKPALDKLAGLFHIISLLAAGGSANLKTAKELLEISIRQDLFPSDIAKKLLIVIAQQSGLPHEAVWIPSNSFHIPTLYRFFYYLSIWWADCDRAITCADQILRHVHSSALTNDYLWLAAESASLLAAIGKESSKYSRIANDLHAQCGTVSLVNAIIPKDKSMQRLHALLAIVGKEQQNNGLDAPTEQRLSWVYKEKDRTFAPFPPETQQKRQVEQGKKCRPQKHV